MFLRVLMLVAALSGVLAFAPTALARTPPPLIGQYGVSCDIDGVWEIREVYATGVGSPERWTIMDGMARNAAGAQGPVRTGPGRDGADWGVTIDWTSPRETGRIYFQGDNRNRCRGEGEWEARGGLRPVRSRIRAQRAGDAPTGAAPIIGQARPEGTVQILEVRGEVEISPGGDDSRAYRLAPGGRVQAFDRVVTGMNSSVRLRFPDGSVVTVSELADMKIAAFNDAGDAVQTRLWLRGGEVSASVNKSSERPSDFCVKTPTATCGVRGTTYSVEAGEGFTRFRVSEGRLLITPADRALSSVMALPGADVRVTSRGVAGSGPFEVLPRDASADIVDPRMTAYFRQPPGRVAARGAPSGAAPATVWPAAPASPGAAPVSMTFAWAGFAGDVVAGAEPAFRDGLVDGTFTLDVDSAQPVVVRKIELFNLDDPGQNWSTQNPASYLLGVSPPGGTLFNDRHRSGFASLASGRTRMVLHATDAGTFADGGRFRVVVTLADGRSVDQTARIGAAAGRVAGPTPVAGRRYEWIDNGVRIGEIVFNANGTTVNTWSQEFRNGYWRQEPDGSILAWTANKEYVARLRWDPARGAYVGPRDPTSRIQDGIVSVMRMLP